jgi:2'-5' RNA ligase
MATLTDIDYAALARKFGGTTVGHSGSKDLETGSTESLPEQGGADAAPAAVSGAWPAGWEGSPLHKLKKEAAKRKPAKTPAKTAKINLPAKSLPEDDGRSSHLMEYLRTGGNQAPAPDGLDKAKEFFTHVAQPDPYRTDTKPADTTLAANLTAAKNAAENALVTLPGNMLRRAAGGLGATATDVLRGTRNLAEAASGDDYRQQQVEGAVSDIAHHPVEGTGVPGMLRDYAHNQGPEPGLTFLSKVGGDLLQALAVEKGVKGYAALKDHLTTRLPRIETAGEVIPPEPTPGGLPTGAPGPATIDGDMGGPSGPATPVSPKAGPRGELPPPSTPIAAEELGLAGAETGGGAVAAPVEQPDAPRSYATGGALQPEPGAQTQAEPQAGKSTLVQELEESILDRVVRHTETVDAVRADLEGMGLGSEDIARVIAAIQEEGVAALDRGDVKAAVEAAHHQILLEAQVSGAGANQWARGAAAGGAETPEGTAMVRQGPSAPVPTTAEPVTEPAEAGATGSSLSPETVAVAAAAEPPVPEPEAGYVGKVAKKIGKGKKARKEAAGQGTLFPAGQTQAGQENQDQDQDQVSAPAPTPVNRLSGDEPQPEQAKPKAEVEWNEKGRAFEATAPEGYADPDGGVTKIAEVGKGKEFRTKPLAQRAIAKWEAGLVPAAPGAKKFKFGNTQAPVPKDSDAYGAFTALQAGVDDGDLAGQGKDVDEPHVTVRYGIQSDDLEGIKKYLEALPPFDVQLGKTEIFPPSKSSDGAAVVNVPVESPTLHQINDEIEKHGSFAEPSFKEYKPHLTVAYVKPEAADKYKGMDGGAGKSFRISAVDITDQNGNKTTVQLKGDKPPTEPAPSRTDLTAPSAAPAAPALSAAPEPAQRPNIVHRETLPGAKDHQARAYRNTTDLERAQHELVAINKERADLQATTGQLISGSAPLLTIQRLKQGLEQLNQRRQAAQNRLNQLEQEYAALKEADPNIGEIRLDARGNPTLYVNATAMKIIQDTASPGREGLLKGSDLTTDEAWWLANRLAMVKPTNAAEEKALPALKRLLRAAINRSHTGGIALVGKMGLGVHSAIDTLREELIHRWQRSRSANGLHETHLSREAFESLFKDLPDAAHEYLRNLGYERDPARGGVELFVIESAAKIMSNKWRRMGLTADQAADWLDKYYDEVTKQHGAQAVAEVTHTFGMAREMQQGWEEKHGAAKEGTAAAAGTQAGAATGRVLPSVEDRGQGKVEGDAGADAGGGRGLTPELERFVAGSKVRNPDGSAKVMYHATQSDIEEFKPYTHFGTQKAAEDRNATLGDFYINELKNPKRFNGANTIPVYLSVKHPLRLPDLASIDEYTGEPLPEGEERGEDQYPRGWENEEAIATTLLERGIIDIDEFEEHRSNDDALKLLEEKGYDGIVYKNAVEDPGQDSWIVFRPEQIKSAMGNHGTFDPENRMDQEKAEEPPKDKDELPIADIPLAKQRPIKSFISPNVFQLDDLADAQRRLDALPNRLMMQESRWLLKELGTEVTARRANGIWKDGAEDSLIHEFPADTDPDLVAYHSAVMAEAGLQKAYLNFFPQEDGNDFMYRLTLPKSAGSADIITKVLSKYGLNESTIINEYSGHAVFIATSGQGETSTRRAIKKALLELGGLDGEARVRHLRGRSEFVGDDDRGRAGQVFRRVIEDKEKLHPEWREIRGRLESRPDFNELRRTVGEDLDLFESQQKKEAEQGGAKIGVVHYSNSPDIEALDPSRYGENKTHDVSGQKVNRPDQARKEGYPQHWRDESFVGDDSDPKFREKAAERFAARKFTYKGEVNAAKIYDMNADPDGILAKSRRELGALNFKKHGVRMPPSESAVQALAISKLKEIGYAGRRDINGMIALWKPLPVKQTGIHPEDDVKNISRHFEGDNFAERRAAITGAGNAYDPDSLLTGAEHAKGMTYDNSYRAYPSQAVYDHIVSGKVSTEEVLRLAPRKLKTGGPAELKSEAYARHPETGLAARQVAAKRSAHPGGITGHFEGDNFDERRASIVGAGNAYNPDSLMTGAELARGMTPFNSYRDYPSQAEYDRIASGHVSTEEVLRIAPRRFKPVEDDADRPRRMDMGERPRTAAQKREQQRLEDELSAFDPNANMGERKGAALIAADGTTAVGDDHIKIKGAVGYGKYRGHSWEEPFLKDGGVRLRSHNGEVNIGFGNDEPETFEVVRNAIRAVPTTRGGGNDFVVEYVAFRPDGLPSWTNSRTWNGQRDAALAKLDEWEANGVRPAPAHGSVAHFRELGDEADRPQRFDMEGKPKGKPLSIEEAKEQAEKLRPKGSSVPIMEAALTPRYSVIGDKRGRGEMSTIAGHLEGATRKTLRPLLPEENTRRRNLMIRRAVEIGKDELKYQLAQENNGAHWYKSDIKELVLWMRKLHPELVNPSKDRMFRALAAATSPGQTAAFANIDIAEQAYGLYDETGKIPLVRADGTSWGTYGNAPLVTLQAVLDHFDGDESKAMRWLLTQHPRAELEEAKASAGFSKSRVKAALPPDADEDKLYGAYVFGAKVGPFYLNLNGISTELTVDRWFMRTWNRWMGTLVGTDGQIQDVPKGKAERAAMIGAISELEKEFGLETSQVQAALWYYEQGLYTRLGQTGTFGGTYADAGQKVYELRTNPDAEYGGEDAGGRSDADKGRVSRGHGTNSGEARDDDSEGEGGRSTGFLFGEDPTSFDPAELIDEAERRDPRRGARVR